MHTTEITAKVFDTGEEVTVNPMIAFDCDDTITFYFVDEDDRALWSAGDGQWLIDNRSGNYECAERIEGISGANDEEVEDSVNGVLASYGFRLGDFDEDRRDRYCLVSL